MAARRESLIRAACQGRLHEFKGLLLPDPSASLQEAEFTLEKLFAVAACHQHYEILNFCISVGVKVNDDTLRMAILKTNRLDVYTAVIAAGFELNYHHDGTVGGPLIWATNDIPLLKYLLDHGADVNRDLQNGTYRPLAKAAEKNNIEMIELFLQHGAQIDRVGALIVAAKHGNLEAVQCLISRGANIDLIRFNDTDM